MGKKDTKKYANFSNVEQQHEVLTAQELPEGPYGSPINADQPLQGKSTSWEPGQYRDSAYVYPDKAAHDDLPRQYPGAHPLHDEYDEKEDPK